MRLDVEYPAYAGVVTALEAVLAGWPGVIVAIDGHPGFGKSTLGRYLAWRFQVSLIETDWFLVEHQGRFAYRADELRRVIEHRLGRSNGGRPVIVDGAVILRVLANLDLKPAFSLRARRSEVSGISREFAAYRRAYPDDRVDLVVTLDP